jgi:hypothetical protein
MYLVIPKTPLGTDETGALAQVATMSTLAQVALAIAVGAILWRVIEAFRTTSLERNMFAPWADIGPAFAKALSLGPAFGLTHLL